MKLAPLPGNKDSLGDPMPANMCRWICDDCLAVCNFEAMNQCHGGPCPFDVDKPISNNECFAFIIHGTPEEL
jgi:hypothetical protein